MQKIDSLLVRFDFFFFISFLVTIPFTFSPISFTLPKNHFTENWNFKRNIFQQLYEELQLDYFNIFIIIFRRSKCIIFRP